MNKIRDLVYKKLRKLTKNKIEDSSNVYELGIDSLDFIEVITDIEEEFEIHVSDDELSAIKTVNDVISTFGVAFKNKEDSDKE